MEPDGVWPDVHEAYFYEIWRDRIPFLKPRKFHKFSKCDACGLFNEMIFVEDSNFSLKGKLKNIYMYIYIKSSIDPFIYCDVLIIFAHNFFQLNMQE